MENRFSLLEQLKQQSLAIISLCIAILALCYNTWRDEETEKNRNTRAAAFEVLKQLGELQLAVNYAHYAPKNSMENPILGWGHLAIITDLSELLPAPIPEGADKLHAVWSSEWTHLEESEESTEQISGQIDNMRQAILKVIRGLR